MLLIDYLSGGIDDGLSSTVRRKTVCGCVNMGNAVVGLVNTGPRSVSAKIGLAGFDGLVCTTDASGEADTPNITEYAHPENARTKRISTYKIILKTSWCVSFNIYE